MYKPGKWKAVCDVCGFEYLNTDLKERWDGVMVCEKDFETRHPQEFGRTVIDEQSVPWSRPEPEDVFIDVTYVEATPTIPPGTFD